MTTVVNIIPPPIPIIPEKKPMADPIISDPVILDGTILFFSVPKILSILSIAMAKKKPNIFL